MAYLLDSPLISFGINSDPFDANLSAVEGSFVDVSNCTGGDRMRTGDQVSIRKRVRLW